MKRTAPRLPVRPASRQWLLSLVLLFAAAPALAQSDAEVRLHAEAHVLSDDIEPGQQFMAFRHLGALRLRGSGHQAREAVAGLSGLAWDEDENLLYAVSDRGWLVHLRPLFDGESGRLTGARLVHQVKLLDGTGRWLRNKRGDAEGLAGWNTRNGKRGDTRLFVSFERAPRIVEYRTSGRPVRPLKLPTYLRDPLFYENPNRGMEALAYHPHYGWLTAPELPQKPFPATRDTVPAPDGQVPIASLERRWPVSAYPLSDAWNSSLVAMEVMPDGSLLTMERGYGLLYSPITVEFRRSTPLPRRPDEKPSPLLPVRTIAKLNSAQGWHLDNFEGLAHHQGRRFFMVSDDNDNLLQKTILSYFELVD